MPISDSTSLLLYMSPVPSLTMTTVATATATLSFIRSLGGTTGISIGGAIYGSEVNKRLASVVGYSAPDGNAFAGNVSGLSQILPLSLRQEVLHAYTRSLSTIWFVRSLSLYVCETRADEDGAVVSPDLVHWVHPLVVH